MSVRVAFDARGSAECAAWSDMSRGRYPTADSNGSHAESTATTRRSSLGASVRRRRLHPQAADAALPPTVVLLGRFSLIRGGHRLALAPASQRLLAFVALSGRAVNRDRAAGVLWPAVPEERAHTNLRSALARLRTSAAGVLRADAVDLAFAADVRVDLHEVQAYAREVLGTAHDRVPTGLVETAMTAISAFSADLLPGWYDEWVLLEAEGWHQLRLHALETLSSLLAREKRYGEAVAAAQTAVGADPLRESAHAALITAHLREGNQTEALREFERYRRQLHELGLKPTQRLRSLLPC